MWAKNHEAHNILGKNNGGLLSEILNLFRLSSKIEINVWFLSKKYPTSTKSTDFNFNKLPKQKVWGWLFYHLVKLQIKFEVVR